MIYNEWYAVLSSREVKKGKITAARRFGKDLVFFRNEGGELGCADGLCAHRKASLAKGWIDHDHIKCPFHGIEYDVTGKCVYVPSEGRASTLSYERYISPPIPSGRSETSSLSGMGRKNRRSLKFSRTLPVPGMRGGITGRQIIPE